VTEDSQIRSDVCLAIPKPVQPQGEVIGKDIPGPNRSNFSNSASQGEINVKEIPGGKYAAFSYQGPFSNLSFVYDAIFSEWLPASGCELRDLPVFEKYCNDPTRIAPEKLKTEIYVPIM
jgi:AraC family transcriptional regulator